MRRVWDPHEYISGDVESADDREKSGAHEAGVSQVEGDGENKMAGKGRAGDYK